MQTFRIWLTLAFWLTTTAGADVLVTREGHQIETRSAWKIDGQRVVFTSTVGQLSSIRLSEIDLQASEEATQQAARAAENDLKNTEAEPEDKMTPLAQAILAAYEAEKKESTFSFTHKQIRVASPYSKDWSAAERLMVSFQDGALAAIEEFKQLAVDYDLTTTEGLRAAAGDIRRIAGKIRGLLHQQLPDTRQALEERLAVAKLADYLEQLAALANSDPEAALWMLSTLEWSE